MEELRKAVGSCTQRLSLGLVSKELQIFSRLVYRNKSQHHRDKSFQKIHRVSKELKRYLSAGLPNSLKGLTKLLPCSGPLQLLPPGAQEHAYAVATKLMECGTFTAKLIAFIEKSFGDVHQRLTMSLFVPFNLLMAASLSRIWFCLRYHLLAVAQTFDTLRPLLSGEMKVPLSITQHLGRGYRKYLTQPVIAQPAASRGAENFKALSIDNASSLDRIVVDEAVDTQMASRVKDMGVRVALNQEQLISRQKDFAVPANPVSSHEPQNRQSAAAAPATNQSVANVPKSRKPNAVAIYFRKGNKLLKATARSRTLLLQLEQYAGTAALVARDIRLCKKRFPRSPFHRYLYSLRLCALRKAPHQKPRKSKARVLQLQNEETERPSEEKAVQELQQRFAEEMEAASLEPVEFQTGGDSSSRESLVDIETLDKNHEQERLLETSASSSASVSEKDDIDDIFRVLESTNH